MNKRLLKHLLIAANILPSMALANSVQIFAGLAFDNPARLIEVKDKQFIFDAAYIDASLDFRGTSGGGTGTAHGTSKGVLPYFRYATRINKQIVVGLDVTEPYFTDIQYPQNSIVRYAAVRTHIDTIDIAPNIAWQILDQFAVGFGFDAQYGKANLDTMVPTLIGDKLFKNSGTGWGYGAHAGVLYKPSIATSVGLSYFTSIAQPFKGPSTFFGMPKTSDSTVVNLPATTTLHFLQAFSQQLAVSGSLSYTQWSVLENIPLVNTALGTLTPIPFNYHNTWRLALGGQYKFTDLFGVRGGFAYDQSPSNNTDRGVGLPTGDIFSVGVGVLYAFTKQISVNLDYAHSFIKTASINNVRTVTFGNERLAADRVEGKVTMNI